jgi:iron complex outermembrane recepter protein
MWMFSQELRLVSNTQSSIDYVVGLFYQDQTLTSTQDSYLRGFKTWWDTAFPAFSAAVTGDRDFIYRRDETFKDQAAYGELTYHFTDAVRATLGARYFKNEFTNDTFMDIPIYAALSAPTNPVFNVDEDDVLLKGNVSWDVSDRQMLYATVSEGYRRGGANAVPLAGRYAEDADWQRYDSDSVLNYELGLKSSGDSHRYTLSLFYVDWDDVQVNTATSNWGFFAVRNGGQARSMGLEFELDGYLTDSIHYGVGYAYVDAELREDIFAHNNSVTPLAVSGAQLPGTANHTFNVAMDYTHVLGNGMRWVSRIDAYYQSSTRNALNNSSRFNVKLDSFQLWNLGTTLSSNTWDASLFLRNIFNEEGVTGVFTEAYMGAAPAVNYLGNGSKEFISTPRAIGASINYHF